MWARPRMTQKCANLVRRPRREDVFELAGLLLDLRLALEGKAVGKQPLGETVTPDDISRALTPPRSEFHDHAAVTH